MRVNQFDEDGWQIKEDQCNSIMIKLPNGNAFGIKVVDNKLHISVSEQPLVVEPWGCHDIAISQKNEKSGVQE